jgi:predicted dinucleotide-binding enzyme
MKIAIIGAGNIGSVLAVKLIAAGHTVLVGAQFPLSASAAQLATQIGEDRFTGIESAVQQAAVIIIAVPLQAVPDVSKLLGDTTGKVIIETTNAFGKPLPGYTDGTAAIKDITGNKDVVKCFNTIGAEDLANPQFGVLKADAFVAGDSSAAKKSAVKLALDLGFEHCYDLGGDAAIALLENLAATWGALAYKAGLGRRVAFKILSE